MNMKRKTLAAIAAMCMAMASAFADEKSDALIAAARERNTKAVARLIKAGAYVNAQDIGGWTALMCAASYNAADMIALLKAADAKTEK